MRIEYLADTRGRGYLSRSLKRLPPQALTKIRRALSTLEKQTWPEIVEGNLLGRQGVVHGDPVYRIRIRGKPEYRIVALLVEQRGKHILLVGDLVTRESLNKKHAKASFMRRALAARERWLDPLLNRDEDEQE